MNVQAIWRKGNRDQRRSKEHSDFLFVVSLCKMLLKDPHGLVSNLFMRLCVIQSNRIGLSWELRHALHRSHETLLWT